ncbi:C2H2-type zinc finger protein [Endozoicomonas sp. 4G]|uniref:C2H2-type zinc finger protein n=1 Tax=Endozoicomonas sp. 4G TaxID=2872754 RepID=UPI0020790093|nr:C2H2-type zinc finger protein [Endozoicomonas sp. 4G]
MLSKKPFILTLAVVFSVHCSNGHGQENSLSLLFALFVGKTLITLPNYFMGDEQQREIIAIAKQMGNLMLSRFRSDKRPGESVKPDTRYCFSPDSGVEARGYSRAASDDSTYSEDSDSEDSGGSDERSDNHSNEEETDTESDVQYVTTTLNPFRASNEINEYCAALALKKIKQEPVSGSEIITESEENATATNSAKHLEINSLNYSTDSISHLKKHKQAHLPDDQKPRRHQCDYEGCNYSTYRARNLKKHKQSHLPVDQRAKVHQCQHEGCNYSSDRTDHLKTHKRTHLPADERTRVHQCDHEGCNYSTDRTDDLKKHKQIHLPADRRPKRPKIHQCDHQDCDYSTYNSNSLKTHKQTHLPDDQRARVHRCDHQGCNYSTDLKSNLKKHKQTHLPANQRPKRKAYEQTPSYEKKMKVDKE